MARDSERPLSDKRKGDVRSMKRVKTTLILGLRTGLLLAIANLDILQNKRLENAQQVGRTLARSYAVEEGRSVSILAVTANAFAEDIAATTEVGMNAHISKPIAFGILYQNLVEQMRRKGLEEGRSDVGTA